MAVQPNLLVFIVIVVDFIIYNANGLSCVKCDDHPCEIPACCESGNYVHDVCGCCPICARAPGQQCGGPWGISGRCSKGLACLRTCECTTLPSAADVHKHKCIFPFKYQEITYNGCTTKHSDNGDRWCAYEVDEDGVVLDGKRGDCNAACPNDGEEAPDCDESSLSNLDGTCVNAAMERTLDRATVGFAFKFDTEATDTEPAPVCKTEEVESNEFRCGITEESAAAIANDLSVGTWPWMASIGYFKDKEVKKEWKHLCGATLISHEYFLTAAHCIQEISQEWKILAGLSDFSDAKTNRFVKVLDILNTFSHPRFNEKNAYFDIALLRIKPENFTKRFSPICLPVLPISDQNKYDYRLMDVTGWGSSSSTGTTASTLRRATIQVFEQNFCNETYSSASTHPSYKNKVESSVPNLFQSQIICAGLTQGATGICQGDSGGPLFYYNTHDKSYFQIGIVHGSLECGSSVYPGIYIRLDDPDIFEFIKKKV